MNLNSKKLIIPDLISVGVFTAIYFVLVTIATFSCALLPGVGNILLPAVAALISGSVYMLLAAKLQKFGGISIMGLVMGLFFFCVWSLCVVLCRQHRLRRAGRLGGKPQPVPQQKGAAGQLCHLFVWSHRPDPAAVVHEGCLHC